MAERITRRTILASAGATGPLAACTTGGGGAGDAAPGGKARQSASLTFSLQGDAKSFALNDSLAQEYARQNPNVKVALELATESALEYETKLTNMFASGTGPDLFQTANSNTPKYIVRNVLVKAPKNLDALVRREALNEGVLQALSDPKGVVYGAPWASDWTALFYNVAHFAEAGLNPQQPPKTIDEFASVAQKLTKSDGGKLTRSGFFVRRTGAGSGILEKFYPFFTAFGGKLYNADTTAIAWGSEPGIRALTWYGDLVQKLRVDSDDVPGDSTGFRNQQVAMYHRETTNIVRFQTQNPELKFATASLPNGAAKSDTVANVDGVVVTTQSKAPDEAWRLVEYFASPAVDLRRCKELTLTPTYKFTANDPAFKNDPYYPAWFQQMTHPLPNHPRINEVNTVLGNLVAQVCQGKIGVREAISQGERDGTALLKQA